MKQGQKKLVLGLLTLFPLAAALGGGLVLHFFQTQELKQRRLRAVRETVQSYLEETSERLLSSLASLAAHTQMERLLADMVRGEPAERSTIPLAEQWRSERGLDLLTLTDGKGRVLSCGHLPARFGENEPALAVAPARTVLMRREPTLEAGTIQPRLALVALERRSFEGATLVLMGGVILEGSWLSRLERISGAQLGIIEPTEGQTGAGLPERVDLPPPLEGAEAALSLLVPADDIELMGSRLPWLAVLSLVVWLAAWWLGWRLFG